MKYEPYLEMYPALKRICLDAGQAILEVYADEAGFEVESKADNSPLTRADKAANLIICSGLEKIDPDIPIISEENRLLPYDQRKDYDRFWLVDPLDGTKEFVKRNGEFTVNIALVEGRRPVLGFVYVPVTGELYRAVKGQGAVLEKDGKKVRLQAAGFRQTDPGLNLVCSRSHLNKETEEFVRQYRAPQLVSRGSSLKFMVLARGEAHVYPRIAPTMEWDTGAAQIILEEAHGKVVRYDNGNPLVYNKENLLNPFFIAYGNLLED